MKPTLAASLLLTAISLPAAEQGWENPLVSGRADPHVHLDGDGWYYLTATVPEQDRIELRRAKTLGGLAKAEVATIWRKPEDGPMSHGVRAPEIHRIDGKWYLYFSAGRKDAEPVLRIHVLENTAASPIEGKWVEKGTMNIDPETSSYDGSTFAHKGRRFFVWARSLPDDRGTGLYIAEMENPWTIKGDPVGISSPKLDWERRGSNVNEAPFAIQRNGRIFLSYSASASDANHCIGLLTATEDSNLLDPESWKKSPEPVFASNDETSQYGPGHNCFTTSPDGKTDYQVYHAGNMWQTRARDRAIRAQILKWNPDGTPDLEFPVVDGPFRH